MLFPITGHRKKKQPFCEPFRALQKLVPKTQYFEKFLSILIKKDDVNKKKGGAAQFFEPTPKVAPVGT
jgi:hypothetical protein